MFVLHPKLHTRLIWTVKLNLVRPNGHEQSDLELFCFAVLIRQHKKRGSIRNGNTFKGLTAISFCSLFFIPQWIPFVSPHLSSFLLISAVIIRHLAHLDADIFFFKWRSWRVDTYSYYVALLWWIGCLIPVAAQCYWVMCWLVWDCRESLEKRERKNLHEPAPLWHLLINDVAASIILTLCYGTYLMDWQLKVEGNHSQFPFYIIGMRNL